MVKKAGKSKWFEKISAVKYVRVLLVQQLRESNVKNLRTINTRRIFLHTFCF